MSSDGGRSDGSLNDGGSTVEEGRTHAAAPKLRHILLADKRLMQVAMLSSDHFVGFVFSGERAVEQPHPTVQDRAFSAFADAGNRRGNAFWICCSVADKQHPDYHKLGDYSKQFCNLCGSPINMYEKKSAHKLATIYIIFTLLRISERTKGVAATCRHAAAGLYYMTSMMTSWASRIVGSATTAQPTKVGSAREESLLVVQDDSDPR